MSTFHYRAVDPHRGTFDGTIDAGSIVEATEQLQAQEVDVVAIEAAGARPASWSQRPPDASGRRYEPAEAKPPPAPRDVDVKLRSQPGGIALVMVGGIFTAIGGAFVAVGLGLLAAGNEEGLFVALIPSVHFLIGVVLLRFGLRRWRRRKSLYRDGAVAMATIDGVGYNSSVKVNGRSPYEVVWSFDLDGHRYHDKQSTFDQRVFDYAPGDRLWVLYDADDPEASAEWPPFS